MKIIALTLALMILAACDGTPSRSVQAAADKYLADKYHTIDVQVEQMSEGWRNNGQWVCTNGYDIAYLVNGTDAGYLCIHTDGSIVEIQ